MEDHAALNSNHSTHTNTFNDPRLEVHMSWWGMNGLERSAEYSLEQKIEMIAEAGFDGINGFIPSPKDAERWSKLLERYRLSLSVNAYPKTCNDMAILLKQAKQYGAIQHINVQVMTPFLIDNGAIELLRGIHELSEKAGIPAYIETHRGTITQDLLRTVSYVEALEQLRLTIDMSHYVVAGEMHTISNEAEALMQKLLERTSAIHARVSNGEQVQVDVGPSGEHPMLQHFERWWSSGMKHWRKVARNGDVLPFIVELGPPPYAITVDDYGQRRQEISDRWEQSLLFLRTARRIWSETARV
ncbi:sugar phosphate isomerase/epimerase [Paenibacillus camelliae]|nr:sugar phosphate isomerase/epimerase [Paenibacillus camelliae]